MLEIRNISKTYRAKTGVSVKALDHISLTFPDRGMIFLLGKSGSGKSTLLNVIGGLDTFDADGGEFIIKGKSSKDFRGSDFDAYRNTFIGFIFQEYNILDEFSVGANIALALQLQGKRADEAAINAILDQVDLAGFGHRKPNELSGGQKQRIAIARALIKDPEIIMADEPTGALDSTTGEQVFETLKKLSRNQLVLVVSHDRDFAERFGDRIIELSDGHIISDVSLVHEGTREEDGIRMVGDDLIRIRRGYTLTPEDLAMINAYLAKNDRDIILSRNEKLNGDVCAAAGISDEVGTVSQRPTGQVEVKSYDPKDTQFIKSHLPLRNAFRIGAGSMKHRPVRLIFTILLSFIAFALFGLADTMASYDKVTTIVDSLEDSGMSALAVEVHLRQEYKYYNSQGDLESESVWYYATDTLSDADLEALKTATGLDFLPVYTGHADSYSGIGLSDTVSNSAALKNSIHQTLWADTQCYGIVAMTQDNLDRLGYSLVAGALPTQINEIAITKYHYDMWKQGGIILAGGETITAADLTLTDGDKGILGKKISVALGKDMISYTFTITGVVDTGFSAEKYEALSPDYTGGTMKDSTISTLVNSLMSEVHYGFHGLFMGTAELIDTLPAPMTQGDSSYGAYYYVENGYLTLLETERDEYGNYVNFQCNRVVSSEEAGYFDIIWKEAGKTAFGADDLVIPLSALFYLNTSQLGLTAEVETETAATLIPPLKSELNGLGYIDLILYDEQYLALYNEKASSGGFSPMTAEEFREEIVTRMNHRFGVSLTWDDWYMAASCRECNFPTEASGAVNLMLSFFYPYEQYYFSSALSQDYFQWAAAHLSDLREEADAGDSGFRGFLDTVGAVFFPEEGVYRVLTPADPGYDGYLVASGALYLRGVELGYTDGDGGLFSETAAQKSAEQLAAICNRLGVTLTQAEVDILREGDTFGGNWYLQTVIDGSGNLSFDSYMSAIVAIQWAAAHDDEIEEMLRDLNSELTGFVIGRIGSYDMNGDPVLPTVPAGKDARGVKLFWAACYLLDNQYGSSFPLGVDMRTLRQNAMEDYFADHVTEIPEITMDLVFNSYAGEQKTVFGCSAMTVTGFYRSSGSIGTTEYVLSDIIYPLAVDSEKQMTDEYGHSETILGEHESGKYTFALAAMPRDDRQALTALAELHYNTTAPFIFQMNNHVVETMDEWGDLIETLNKVFLYVGLGFALFAAIMMLNFVSATVTDKKREIGILRAVGARSFDVFLIFFSEAFVVAMVNFLLATAATIAATVGINLALRNELGFPLTLLHFGVRQVALIFGVSLLVALIGTLLPASKIAHKTPVDAMKDR